tara:strand:- start:100 stop:636 length:537 start_codon:yes stop_codon:yes gene_type:complete
MKVLASKLDGCVTIEPMIHRDHRGFFIEVFQVARYAEIIGTSLSFVQDNYSFSTRGVLRGLHFQRKRPQGRLIRVVSGEVFDVAVDIRTQSKTFGHWNAVTLSEQNRRQVWIPPGFAHGFLVLSESAGLEYKCTEYYDPDDEGNILWNDPKLSISWPTDVPILSDKDANAPLFDDLKL